MNKSGEREKKRRSFLFWKMKGGREKITSHLLKPGGGGGMTFVKLRKDTKRGGGGGYHSC